MADEQLNAWAKARYDELRAEGKHGHYETLFRVVQEAVGKKLYSRRKLESDNERMRGALERIANGAGRNWYYESTKALTGGADNGTAEHS